MSFSVTGTNSFREYRNYDFSLKIKVLKHKNTVFIFLMGVFLLGFVKTRAQITTMRGKVMDAENGDPLIGANIRIESTEEGVMTDWDGTFELQTRISPPFDLRISYIGYESETYTFEKEGPPLELMLRPQAVNLESVVVRSERLSEKEKEAPLTVESMDMLAIRQTAAVNFYDGMGSLKDVDLTAASLGFKVINTRGFNSTSPVRSLQIIDGVDNQAPGLNFSLGNFLGASELDVQKVDVVVGASSAYYGPNAFNGVISMETKDPFFHQGLSAYIKGGERRLMETAVRWGQGVKNSDDRQWMAYKFNFFYLKADDWIADNYDPVYDTETGRGNPGGYDAVNIYGDEYSPTNDASTGASWRNPGLGIWHRTGYREIDLVDYDTRNLKTNAAVHFRLRPEQEFLSPELILSASFSSGTTVYQGDNRFSLRDILFFQNRVELRKKDKYFLRAYMTTDDAGKSFDPYFTALRLQEESKEDTRWSIDYSDYYRNTFGKIPEKMGFPKLQTGLDENGNVVATFDYEAAATWIAENQELIREWHQASAEAANLANPRYPSSKDFFVPGTERFRERFDDIVGKKSNDEENGTRFYDKSSLYHLHGEYMFEPGFLKSWRLGGNARLYTPRSEGTIFYDTAGVSITNFEFGLYTGAEKKWGKADRWTTSATIRVDKNQNFDWLVSPAASAIFQPRKNTYLRISFSGAIRNPTLSDQYLDFNVGRAILAGNLHGVDSLIDMDSFSEYRNSLDLKKLKYFSVNPIKPESVNTIEAGIRTSLWNKWYVDAGYYYSRYRQFIGYQIGLKGTFDRSTGFPKDIQAYRYSANSENLVTTQGASIGINYYLSNTITLKGNYSWNKLNKEFEDDPIIPAFNTPEHKFNLGITGHKVGLPFVNPRKTEWGFSLNYKWIEGFLYEGSPQFTGMIPTYDMLDGQISCRLIGLKTTLKLGASNVLNNRQFHTYGGPKIGRLAYFTILYEN